MPKKFGINPVLIKVADYEISAISLGETGRGRKNIIVPCPDAQYLEAGVSKSGKFRLNESKSSDGWILRISTQGAYIRGAHGNVSVHPDYKNEVHLLCKAYGAFGDAGRTGTWDDVILHSKRDALLLRVKPSRGDAYLLFYTSLFQKTERKEPAKLTYPQADALDIDLVGSSPTSRGEFILL